MWNRSNKANDRGRCSLGQPGLTHDWCHQAHLLVEFFQSLCLHRLVSHSFHNLAFEWSFTGLLGNNACWVPAPVSPSLILQYWRRKPFLLLVYFSWGCTRKHQAVIDHILHSTQQERVRETSDERQLIVVPNVTIWPSYSGYSWNHFI